MKFFMFPACALTALMACQPLGPHSGPTSCNHSEMRSLVGLDLQQAERENFNYDVFFIPENSQVTNDFRPSRGRVFYNQAGIVTSASCG